MLERDTILGIDIDAGYVKIVKKEIQGKLIQWLVEPLPEDLMQQDTIKSEKSLALFLKKTLKKARIHEKKCGVCISSDKAIIREFHFPVMVKDSLKENIRYEIAEYLPLGIDNYVIDYRILEDESTLQHNFMRVMAVAVPKDIVHSYVRILKKAGLKPVIMDVSVNCQERWYNEYVSDLDNLSYDYRNVCLIDIESYFTRFTLLYRGVYFIDKASQLLGSKNEDIDIELLIQEITEILSYFYSRISGCQVNSILIMGGGSFINKLPDQVKQRLGIPTALVNMPEDDMTGTYLPNAVGAAFVPKKQSNKQVNLIMAEKPEKNLGSKFFIISAVLIALVIGIWGFWSPIHTKNKLLSQIEILESKGNQYKEVLADYHRIMDEIEALNKKKQRLDHVVKQQVKLSHIFHVIEDHLPSTVDIIEITTDQDRIHLRGKAADDADVANIVISLAETDEFDKVIIEEIILDQTTEFKLFSIQCIVKIYEDIEQKLHAEEEGI